MRSLKTCDGYVFFSSPEGWVDGLKPDGTPYQHDMMLDYETMNEWIQDGDAIEYVWSDKWTPLYEGPFKTEEEAETYRHAEVARHMPTRLRRLHNKYEDRVCWFIECQREVKA